MKIRLPKLSKFRASVEGAVRAAMITGIFFVGSEILKCLLFNTGQGNVYNFVISNSFNKVSGVETIEDEATVNFSDGIDTIIVDPLVGPQLLVDEKEKSPLKVLIANGSDFDQSALMDDMKQIFANLNLNDQPTQANSIKFWPANFEEAQAIQKILRDHFPHRKFSLIPEEVEDYDLLVSIRHI